MCASRRLRRTLSPFLIALSIAAMSGCGGGGGGGPTPPPPIFVSLTPFNQTTLDQGQNANFAATVANDSSNKGVTWSVSGTSCTGSACGILSNTTATTATYNAPTQVSSNLTVSVKATSVADSTKSASSTVMVTPPLGVTTTSLPKSSVGTAYSVTLQATGGTPPITWSVSSGTLPAGLSLSSAGTIFGTPTSTGTSTFTVTASDSGTPPQTANQQLSIPLNPASLTITTTSLPGGKANTPYSATLQAAGGTPPITWSVTSGTLPAGLSLSSSGTISGTPTSTGTSTFTVTATDSGTPPQTDNRATINRAACGSWGNEAVLSGQYIFTLSGYNATGFVALVGAFTADGTGGFTAGEADSNGVLGYQQGYIDTSASSYSVGSDNRGCATIVTSFGTFTTRFALGSISSGTATIGRIIEWENPTSTTYIAAGEIRRQTPASFSAGLSGNYLFLELGDDGTGGRGGSIGALTTASGTISRGEADINFAGTTGHCTDITGSYTGVDASGRGTGSMALPSMFSSHFAYYVASSSQIYFVTTDTLGANTPVFAGEMQQQSMPTGGFNNSSVNGKAVFYAAGLSEAGPGSHAFVGIANANGSGSIDVTTYEDDAGTWQTPTPDNFTCTYSVASNGRMTLSGGSYCTGASVFYLTAANTAFMLGTNQGVDAGQLEPQAVGLFSSASVSGTFLIGTAAVVSQTTETQAGWAALDGTGGVSGVSDFTSTGGQGENFSFVTTYTINSDGTMSPGLPGGTMLGIVIKNDKWVMIDRTSPECPSILVGRQ